MFAVNPLALAITGLIPTVLGMLWYSPLLFADPWMKSMGIQIDDIQDSGVNPAWGYAASAVLGYVLTYGMAVLVGAMGINSFVVGALLGAGVWLVFNFTAVAKYIFFEDRPLLLVLIDGAYDVLTYALVGGVLSVWI
ncbi:MAG: DUF1761 domain-containing protein [Spirochaetaceae bacterium]